jgi:anaerobic magnesium-protoporphyrin IX monomethyl ester cyclase
MKVILYNPQSSASRKHILPLSLLALGALLEGRHEYVIVDGNLERDPLGALDELAVNWGAQVLAMTVMPGPQLAQAVPLARALKERHPGLVMVWGGYFPTQHYQACLRAPYVDFVLRGHAEASFLRLLDRLDTGNAADDVPGLAYRNDGDGAISNAMPPIPNPQELPEFPYHRVPVASYTRDSFLGKRTLPHHSSYGCPFFCNFCAVVNMVAGRWLPQSAERTATVARYLHDQHGADAVEFYDNNFFVHEARTREFAERIDGLGISWWGESRIDTLLRYRPESWRAMAASGLRMVFMGAESGSDETLKRMNKGGSAAVDKTLEMAGVMRSYGIIPEFSFVLGNPPDPDDDTNRTIEFIRKVKRVNSRAEIVMYVYTPVPLAGDLYDAARAEGFRFPETLDEWVSADWSDFSQRKGARLPWMRNALRTRVRQFERVLNAYYPTATNDRVLRGPVCWILRTFSSWRYHLRLYDLPVELRMLEKVVGGYQRPETRGA